MTGYGWDSLGRVATMNYPQTVDGAQVSLAYHYDSTGNLDVVEQDIGGGGSFWMRVYDLQSHGCGRPAAACQAWQLQPDR